MKYGPLSIDLSCLRLDEIETQLTQLAKSLTTRSVVPSYISEHSHDCKIKTYIVRPLHSIKKVSIEAHKRHKTY